MEFAQRSNDLLMNLWGRKWFPRLIPLPSSSSFFFFNVRFIEVSFTYSKTLPVYIYSSVSFEKHI